MKKYICNVHCNTTDELVGTFEFLQDERANSYAFESALMTARNTWCAENGLAGVRYYVEVVSECSVIESLVQRVTAHYTNFLTQRRNKAWTHYL